MQYLAQLNYEYPGLEQAGQAYRRGDLAEAERFVLAYYRNRKEPAWYGRIEPEANEEDLRLIRERVFAFQSRQVHLSDPIDWRVNPVGDPEWTYSFNRHPYFRTLLLAYLKTGDETHACELDGLINSWCRNCPRPDAVVPGEMNWRSIETGIRMFSWWIPVWLYLQPSPSFRDETRSLMLQAFADHGWVLMNLGKVSGNWVLMENNGLAHLATYFPEFRDAPLWLETARKRLEHEMQVQVLDDGGQIELTTHYHIVSLRNFLHPMALPGYTAPDWYVAKLHKMIDWLEALQRPDHSLLQIQDSAMHVLPVVNMTERFLRWEWLDGVPADLALRLTEAPPVPEASTALPDTGYYAMRTADRCLVADAAPFGYGHQHEDKLSVDLWALGDHLIIDPGIYSYTRERIYFTYTGSHSTVMADGMGQNRRSAASPTQPRPERWWKAALNPPVRWRSGPETDFLDAVYDEGYGPENDRSVTHRRRILFVKPHYWFVLDDLLPGPGDDGREHTCEQLWHLRPGAAALDGAAGAAWTVDSIRANVLILSDRHNDVRLFSGGLNVDRSDMLQGWHSPAYSTRIPAPLVSFRSVGPAPVQMAALIYPFPAGERPAVSLERVEGGWQVDHPHGRDLILLDGDDLRVAR